MDYDIIHRPQMLVAKRNRQSPVGLSQLFRNDYLREKSNMNAKEQNDRRFISYVNRCNQKDVSIVDLVGRESILNQDSPADSRHSRSIEQLRLPLIQSVIFKTIEDRRSVEVQQKTSQLHTVKYGADELLSKLQQSTQVIHHRLFPPSKPRPRYRQLQRQQRKSSTELDNSALNVRSEKEIESELKLNEEDPIKPREIVLEESAAQARRALSRRKKKKKAKLPGLPSLHVSLQPPQLKPWDTIDYEPDFEELE